MVSIALNPGFALILGGFGAFAAPRAIRGGVMLAAALACIALIFTPEFGAYDTFAQIGLEVVLLRLDAHAQIFGLAFAFAAILMAIGSSDRRNRYEDAALFFMAGGAASATFAGDLISFVAATELASIAGAWIVLAAGGQAALSAGVRLLIWQGLGGLLLLSGVAFHLADGFDTTFARLPADSVGGAFFLAGLAIKAAAPFVHVWFKDAVASASPVGAAAISIFSVKLALYALARGYSGEAALVPIGAAMAVMGALYALAEDDLRRALSYSLISQCGLAIAAIGIGSPLALAGAAAHAFTTTISYGLLFLALGAVMMRTGTARASELGGLGKAMPLTALFAIVGGLTAATVPGLAGYASAVLALEAVAREGLREAWLALSAALAATAAFTAIRISVGVFFGRARKTDIAEAPFGLLLAMALASFFCVAVGLAPGWLLNMLPPGPVAFSAFALDRLIPHLELVAAAAAGYAALHFLGWAQAGRRGDLLDVDALYRGPFAAAARAVGRLLLGMDRALKAVGRAAMRQAGQGLADFAARTDQPYSARGLVVLGQLTGLFILIAMFYVFAG
ncbi:MAG: proton-conducting transporter membrane subunit [Hyphomonadaceae bacterium]